LHGRGPASTRPLPGVVDGGDGDVVVARLLLAFGICRRLLLLVVVALALAVAVAVAVEGGGRPDRDDGTTDVAPALLFLRVFVVVFAVVFVAVRGTAMPGTRGGRHRRRSTVDGRGRREGERERERRQGVLFQHETRLLRRARGGEGY
jgi:hypothetical protein